MKAFTLFVDDDFRFEKICGAIVVVRKDGAPRVAIIKENIPEDATGLFFNMPAESSSDDAINAMWVRGDKEEEECLED